MISCQLKKKSTISNLKLFDVLYIAELTEDLNGWEVVNNSLITLFRMCKKGSESTKSR